MSNIRGLNIFIHDIRNCSSFEQEQKRVNKELAKIRKKFSGTSLAGYDLKKYLWKIMYMYLLGHDVDFGHMEAVNAITSDKFSEKQVGYVAVEILLIEHEDLLRMCIQSIRNDLLSHNEVHACLALAAVANVGGQEFAESLTPDVQKLLVAGTSRNHVKKKAALCLLRLFRKYPDIIPTAEWAPRVLGLLDQKNIGVLLSVMSLLLGLASNDPDGYDAAVPKVLTILHNLVIARRCPNDYAYYRTPCPWLQIKCLKFIQYFTVAKADMPRLHEILSRIIESTEVTKSVNKNNADHAVLFEAVNLIIHLNQTGHRSLHDKAIALLSKYISVREPNIRYLGLETMAKLAKIPHTLPTIRKHLKTIIFSLKDADISIRRRALDLLYSMCDSTTHKEIIEKLLEFLPNADYHIKEEMVLKIAILAEKFAEDRRFYVDVVLQLVILVGDNVPEDIWYRTVQIVTNDESVQEYAARTVYEALQKEPVHENLVKIGGYILGEFGHLINISGPDQFAALRRRFDTASSETKALLLSSFMKLANMFEELHDQVNDIFAVHQRFLNTEIQQRAVEYNQMNNHPNQQLISAVWEAMPDFPERDSALEKRLRRGNGRAGADLDPHSQEAKDRRRARKERKAQNAQSGSESDASSSSSSGYDSESSSASVDEGTNNGAMSAAAQYEQNAFQQDDMLSGLSQATAKPKTQHQDGGDILDMFGATDSTSSSSSVAFAPESMVQCPAQDEAKLSKLLETDSGVFYETDFLQIGLKSMIENGSLCKLILYFGNKSASQDIQDVQATVKDSLGVRIQIKPEAAFSIGSQKQVAQYLLIHCTQPFPSLPAIELSFRFMGKNHTVPLRLPITATKFFLPSNIDAQGFVSSWKTFGNEEQWIFKGRGGVVDASQMRDLLDKGLHLQVLSGMDQNQNNIVAAGTFHTVSKNQQGHNVTMRALVRFETKPEAGMVRATVRSEHKLVSAAIKASITEIFAQKS